MGIASLIASLAAALGLTAVAFGLTAIVRARSMPHSVRATGARRPRLAPLASLARDAWEQRTAAAPPAVRFGIVVWIAAGLFAFAAIPFGPTLLAGDGSGALRPIVVPSLAGGLVWVIATWGLANVAGIVAAESRAELDTAMRRGAAFIPLVLAIFGAVATSGTLDVSAMIAAQGRTGVWNAFPHPLGCVAFVLCASAVHQSGGLPAVDAADSAFASLRRPFPAAFAVGLAMQQLLAAYMVVAAYFGGWHLWGIATAPASVGGWGDWTLAIIVLHAKALAVLWAWMRWESHLRLGRSVWAAPTALGLADLALALLPFERAFGEAGWLARAAIGWCGLVAIIGLRNSALPRNPSP